MQVTLREDLAVALLDRFRREGPRPSIHVSDLATPCLRRSYYSKKGLAPAEDSDILLWMAGKAHHSLIEGRLRELKFEENGITGTIDCLEKGDTQGRIVTEFKTTRASSKKDVTKDYFWWIEQVMAYLHLFGDAVARLYVLHLMGTWSPPTEPHLVAYELGFTERELADNWQKMLERKVLLLRSLQNTEPPPGPHPGMEWGCKNCPAKEACDEDKNG